VASPSVQIPGKDLPQRSKTDATGEPVILIRGLVTRFGQEVIHDHLDLDVAKGEILGVVGGSGSGKSVLLRTIVGLNRPAGGRIEVLGTDVSHMRPRARMRLQQQWGVLFQNGALFSGLTVAENVAVPLREHRHLSPSLISEIAAVKVALVGLPREAATKHPAQLSGGMRKRAGLARALALDPEILFLDEPTAGLDPIAAADFDQLILSLRASLGLTVFMVTHDLDSLEAICDRVAVLIDRRITIGTLQTLKHNPHPWIQEYFTGPRARAALS